MFADFDAEVLEGGVGAAFVPEDLHAFARDVFRVGLGRAAGYLKHSGGLVTCEERFENLSLNNRADFGGDEGAFVAEGAPDAGEIGALNLDIVVYKASLAFYRLAK